MTARPPPLCVKVFDVRCPYLEVLRWQKALVRELQWDPSNRSIYVLGGEHPPTYTGGQSLGEEGLRGLKKNFLGAVVKTSRGGRLMYHGPGQLTLYFIFHLKNHFSGPKEYVKEVFKGLTDYFKLQHALKTECRGPGLWFKGKKVGFMGLRIKEGVVYHGLSLNYHVNLEPFLKHAPCDIRASQVGNLFSTPWSEGALKKEAQCLVEFLPFLSLS